MGTPDNSLEDRLSNCAETAVQSYERCDENEDQGYERCDDWEDQGYNVCDSWGIFSVVCVVFVWVAKWICVAWTWVSKWVCVAWTIVEHVFCVVWSYVLVTVLRILMIWIFKKRIDVHCHLFTAGDGALYIIKSLLDILDRNGQQSDDLGNSNESSTTETVPETGDDSLIYSLMCLFHFYKIIKDNPNCYFIYRELRNTYGMEYRITPLMLDLAYITTTGGLSDKLEQLDILFDQIDNQLNSRYGSQLDAIAEGLNIEPIEIDVLGAVREIKQFVVAYIQIASTVAGGPTVTDFEGQTSQLQELVKSYKSTVFPFLAVDPRREGIFDLVKKLVGGPDKPFRGIKLYTPMGFSPTDPVLFGESKGDDCLYRYCEAKGIPITAHCSPGGFSTFDDSANINGLIRIRGTGVTVVDGSQGSVDSDGLCLVNGTVKFSRSISDGFGEMVRERSIALNHPTIWRKVLEKYSGLYLNLAHFGGDAEVDAYVNRIRNGNADSYNEPVPWTKLIITLMGQFDNVYTDLSCHSYSEALRRFYKTIYSSDLLSLKVKNKIMYGSDYDIVMLFILRFENYVNNFTDIFSDEEFTNITVDNPYHFLFERNGDGGAPFWRRFVL